MCIYIYYIFIYYICIILYIYIYYITYINLSISIYLYIYILKEMLTLNVWLQIYGLKNTHNLLKAQIFLFSSEVLPMCQSFIALTTHWQSFWKEEKYLCF